MCIVQKYSSRLIYILLHSIINIEITYAQKKNIMQMKYNGSFVLITKQSFSTSYTKLVKHGRSNLLSLI